MTPGSPEIQAIVEEYRAVGWNYVKAHDFGKRLPTIAAWDRSDRFSIQLELGWKNEKPAIHHVSLFVNEVNGAVGGYYFQGKHLGPGEVRTIIETITGKVIKTETEEELITAADPLQRLLETEGE